MKQSEGKEHLTFINAIGQARKSGLTFEQFLSTLERGQQDGQIVYQLKGEIMTLEELRTKFEDQDHREER